MSPKTNHKSSPVVALGVTGGIAAYKAVEVCRLLTKAGVHVVPVLTDSAQQMVGKKTFDALASEESLTSLWTGSNVSPHTELASRIDLAVVCPATARVISDIATGRSADVLTTTLLASVAPLIVCPAMHTEMWENEAVIANIETLRGTGIEIVGPEAGELAGGDIGFGRMSEPDKIVEAVLNRLGIDRSLVERHVVVTAGGTREAIDAVRYITNYSTGKQGHALAEAASRMGAKVTLVTTSDLPSAAGVTRVDVSSSSEMLAALDSRFDGTDVLVMCAAVADFVPKQVEDKKIRKADHLVLELIASPDILKTLSEKRRDDQLIIGFSAQDSEDQTVAIEKLKTKNLDMIVMNNIMSDNAGFASDTNSVIIHSRDGSRLALEHASKASIAHQVMSLVGEATQGINRDDS